MHMPQDAFFKISDLYLAYKKAKSDAFFESIHCDAIAYSRYEKKLHYNLKKLQSRLKKGDWCTDGAWLGRYSYAPKSISMPDSWAASNRHFATADACKDWLRDASRTGENARADFRLIISASVDYQVVNALWIIKVGHLYEQVLDKNLSYGNRLRRKNPAWWSPEEVGEINRDSLGLFMPYFSAYQAWREVGLTAMRRSIVAGDSIIAATMDAKRFYHNVSPNFIVNEAFLERLGIKLSNVQLEFTSQLLTSINLWYSGTPDANDRPEGALPVGLACSKIISNVALAEFDKKLNRQQGLVYYGRYVDDIFIVVNNPGGIDSSSDFFGWLASSAGGDVRYVSEGPGAGSTFFEPAYLRDSKVEFSQEKQKVFLISGAHGLDLIDQIEQQIKKKSSEYRMLPELPSSAGKMLDRALIASPDATLETDALRKAEAVSVRRLGFAMLLSDVEAYTRDLDPGAWIEVRESFYSMVSRHVITPKGIFDYFSYIVRVVGVMVACRDFSSLSRFLSRFQDVCNIVERTAGLSESEKFFLCKSLYAKNFYQVAMQASTVKGFRHTIGFVNGLKKIKEISRIQMQRLSADSLRDLAMDLLMADLGRRPYKEYWISSTKSSDYPVPKIPKDRSIQRELRLAGVRRFRRLVDKQLPTPHWPAIAFPTRPLTVPEISAVAPKLLGKKFQLQRAIFSLRGARTMHSTAPSYDDDNNQPNQPILHVPSSVKDRVRVGLVSFLTEDGDWVNAFNGSPNKSAARYKRFNSLINALLRAESRIDYIIFPEASVPRRWAFSVAAKLARHGISFMAGMENNSSSKFFKNEALISLSTRWPGYATSVAYIQPKLMPAHSESAQLKKVGRIMKKPSARAGRPIYRHGDHFFGVVICSDLTNIDNRRHFRGQVDSLFVLEWNKDIESFSSLVEAASQDLHAYVVQVNSRQYGDSRTRYPGKEGYSRDVVRIKGGDDDYFVVAPLDILAIKRFHASGGKRKDLFKPLPIGFKISAARKLAAANKKK
ncbi:RNA-directed DNA polymerase [Pseudoxanthomonas sp. GM95]|uniref:RNA-directed DNA polymerase n=1 Tax=Pseudoxanthomonas sp. GM95 TaxID=1881043 RepID=UPI000B867141|nr:RNA-directed DNA polymerase [Pseudoxanthomonas sp. GM95]